MDFNLDMKIFKLVFETEEIAINGASSDTIRELNLIVLE